MKIPFVDLKAQYAAIKAEVNSAISDVLESTQFIGGDRLERFENNFAAYADSEFGVGTSSGTSAIHLALTAIGVGRGDEVVTACNTFIATTEAISHSGARPVLVDVLPETLNLDPDKIEQAITPRTKAIVPVHLYGQSADMDAVRDIAARHGIAVIADAAQAHGARYKGSRRATQGELTCYSFYPGKNLGAYGDGGMVVTDDRSLADRMRMLLDHGRNGKYDHKEEGFNYRLDTLQAAILDVKLKYLDEWIERRRSRAKLYDKAFEGGPVCPLFESPDCFHVYHLYVVHAKERDKLLDGLRERGIAAGVHYPLPLHLQEAYQHFGLKEGTYPVAEHAAKEIISLPMYPELSDDMINEVVTAVRTILA